jgi:Putative peptidoglycan binding domain
MSDSMKSSHSKRLKLLAGTAVTALLVGWAAGVGAQPAPQPLPPQQASVPAGTMTNAPPLPLGQNDVREVQNQLIALGYDPGPADGQAGPATISAAQQYDQKHGGNGQVSIDGAFLARLKADSGPRLSYEQVEERSQAHAASAAAAPAPASNQIGGVVQQLAPLVGAIISNANSNNNNGYYGPGPGPGYYGRGPGYYGNGYGGY